jgi:hypothetical protein
MDTVFPHMSMHVRTRDLFGVWNEEQVRACPVLAFDLNVFRIKFKCSHGIFLTTPNILKRLALCSIGIFMSGL